MTAAATRWQDDAEVTAALKTAVQSLTAVEMALLPQAGVAAALGQLLAAYEQGVAATARAVPEPATVTPLTADLLPALAVDLASKEDIRREQARQRLQPKERLSVTQVGETYVVEMAKLARQHKTTYQVGTQFEWGLHWLLFDEPAWLDGWLAAAAADKDGWATRLLGGMHYQNEAFFAAVLARLPLPQGHVNVALLQSWYWLVNLLPTGEENENKRPSEAQLSQAREKLLAWLQGAVGQESDTKTVAALLDLLGAWPEGKTAVGERLLAATALYGQEAYPMALVKQATRVKALRPPVLAWLAERGEAERVQAAWVRLQLAMAPDKEKEQVLLAAVQQWLPDPATALAAVLAAGIDEDVWADEYHGVLVGCGRRLIEMQEVAGAERLLEVVLGRYEAALMEEEAWSKRRMALALVAACLRAMPDAVRAAWARIGSLDSLEKVLVKGSVDEESFSSRRFALTGLSYLPQVSRAVVPVLVDGLLDNVSKTQQAAMEATERFQRIEAGLVDDLAPYLTGESIQVARGVAQMLGRLGTMAAAEDATLRERMTLALVEGLVYLEDKEVVEEHAEKISELEDVVYQALLKVRGVPE